MSETVKKIDASKYPGCKNIDKIQIDFEDLPHYVAYRGVAVQFIEIPLYLVDDYKNWLAKWIAFLETVDRKYHVPAIKKGIEFGRKMAEYHRLHCTNKVNCPVEECYERKIAMAEAYLQDIYRANDMDENGEEIVAEESNETSKEFTTARQVLAMHYLFEYCKVKNVDNTAKARFIQFLTGKETGAKEIKNTTIYKRVSKPFSTDNKTLNADLTYVRGYFEQLGLGEIAKMITNEISQSSK